MEKLRNPWSFSAPPYDQRSSAFVNAGRHFGVGYRTPTGKEKITENYCIPMTEKNAPVKYQ